MKPANPALPEKLQNLLGDITGDEFDAVLRDESIARARRFIQGVKAYRHHPARRDVPDVPVIWQEGSTCLRDYNPHAALAPIVLVIPSLINRYDIFDLDYAPSFLRNMAATGLRPLVVDWGEPSYIEESFSLSDYVKRLNSIVQWIDKNFLVSRLASRAPSLHLLGYCMGGLLALALASLHPDRFKTLTLMATPWDFHQPDPATGILLGELADEWGDALTTAGQMPVDIIQYLFAMLQPFQSVSKYVDFAAMDQGSMEARQFVLLEDWLNDGVPLPIKVAKECLSDWYGKNLTAHYAWSVDGKIIDPRQLHMPTYVVVAGRDKIVPPESALPLAKLLPHSTLHEPMTGHIGMMASKQASHQIWKPLLHWLDEHL